MKRSAFQSGVVAVGIGLMLGVAAAQGATGPTTYTGAHSSGSQFNVNWSGPHPHQSPQSFPAGVIITSIPAGGVINNCRILDAVILGTNQRTSSFPVGSRGSETWSVTLDGNKTALVLVSFTSNGSTTALSSTATVIKPSGVEEPVTTPEKPKPVPPLPGGASG